MVELVDTPALEAGAFGRESSSLSTRTSKYNKGGRMAKHVKHGKKKSLNVMAKKATGSKKPAKGRKATAKGPIPTAGKIQTGGAVAAAAPLGFNNALPAAGAKSEPAKKKARKGKKENAGRRKARGAVR